MMNFIAFGLVSYLTQHKYRRQGDPILQTLPIAEEVNGELVGPHIPRMHDLLSPLGIDFPERLPLNLAFLMALIACVAVYIFHLEDEMGLRTSGSWVSAYCGGVRWDFNREEYSLCDGDFRDPCRNGWNQRGPWIPISILRWFFG